MNWTRGKRWDLTLAPFPPLSLLVLRTWFLTLLPLSRDHFSRDASTSTEDACNFFSQADDYPPNSHLAVKKVALYRIWKFSLSFRKNVNLKKIKIKQFLYYPEYLKNLNYIFLILFLFNKIKIFREIKSTRSHYLYNKSFTNSHFAIQIA